MLWKIGGAIITALLAAIITIIAGVSSDARTGTVMLRAVLVFALSGFGLVLGMLVIERYGIPFYMSKHKDKEQSDWLKLYLMLKEMEKKGQPEEQLAEASIEENPSVLDVSISEEVMPEAVEMAGSPAEPEPVQAEAEPAGAGDKQPEGDLAEPLTEEEIASLTDGQPKDEMTEPDLVKESDASKEEKSPLAEGEPAFEPLSVSDMTRLTASEKVNA